MGRKTLRDEYFSWLYKHISDKGRTYVKLCKELHKKPFRWTLDMDENRCEDGLELRDLFADDLHLDEDHVEVQYFMRDKCTIFEVMIALARRMNDLMYDLNSQEDQTPRWFREMLQNLKLAHYTDNQSDDDLFSPTDEAKIDEILEILCDRTYDTFGNGGLFPLKKRHPKDQRDVEIWYQLMAYLDENNGS